MTKNTAQEEKSNGGPPRRARILLGVPPYHTPGGTGTYHNEEYLLNWLFSVDIARRRNCPMSVILYDLQITNINKTKLHSPCIHTSRHGFPN